MLAAYARFVVDHRAAVLVGTVAVTVALGLATRGLTLRFDVDAAFPTDDPAVQIDRQIQGEFGGRRFVVIAVVPHDGDVWQPAVLRTVHGLTLGVRAIPDVIDKDLVSLAAPSVRQVEVSDGSIREDYLMREPPESADDIARLRDIVRADPLLRGGVVTEDERAALVLADFWPSADMEQIGHEIAGVLARFRNPALALHATGAPIFVAAERAYLQKIPLYFGAAVAIMMAMLLLSFRTWQGMVLPIATGFLAVAWALGLMAATGVPLSLWNQSVPILIVVVAAGHSAQMLKRYYEELAARGDNAPAVIASLASIGPVMLAAGGTAALGFASLALFGVPGMSDLGLAAAYGIGSAVVLEVSFMPALRACLRPRGGRREAEARGGIRLLGDLLLSRAGRGAILGVGALTLAWAAAGVPRLLPPGSTREYLPAGSAATRDLEAIRTHFPGTVTMGILFDGPPGSATAPQTLVALDRLAGALAAEPNVGRTASLADLVKKLNAVFTPEQRWELPADPTLLAQLLFLGRGPAFERLVDRSDARTVLWAYLRSDEPAAVRGVLDRARAEVPRLGLPDGVQVKLAGGVGPMTLALQERVIAGKVWNVGALILAVYVLSSVVLRSPVAGLFVVMPLVYAVAITVGILAWAGIRFDLITASIVAIAVGIGADYAIYFLYRLREEYLRGRPLEAALRRALETSGRAVVFVALAIALGFGVFAPSAYRAFQLTGLLTPAGMLASCLAAISVMPAALLATRPAFLFGARLDTAGACGQVTQSVD